MTQSALDLLLGADIGVVAALAFPAVGCLEGKTSVALSADHFVALVFPGKHGERGFDFDGAHAAAAEAQDEVES